jgi:peroxiredoxin
MRKLLFAGFLLFSLVASHAAVVRLAPDFIFPGAGNKTRSLRSLRGQAVVLLIAKSPDTGAFKKQVKYLRENYEQFAGKGVVFVAAFSEGTGPVKSNIPFAVANNGAAIMSAYGVQGEFNLVIIGQDGNVDYQTEKVCPPERVRDVIQNSFVVQEDSRKGQDKAQSRRRCASPSSPIRTTASPPICARSSRRPMKSGISAMSARRWSSWRCKTSARRSGWSGEIATIISPGRSS